MAADTDAVIRKVRSVLSRCAREHLGNGASIRVERSDYKNYIHVYVTSKRFKGTSMIARGKRVLEWLEAKLDPSTLKQITLVMTLTPAEKRDLLIA